VGISVTFDPVIVGKGFVLGSSTEVGYDVFTGVNSIVATNFSDRLVGGPGDEVFRPGNGNDFVDGGPGIDFVDFYGMTTGFEGVTASLSLLGSAQFVGIFEGIDVYLNVEGFYGSFFGDVLTGDNFDNFLFGREGNDTLHGADGNDELTGGPGNDTLFGGDGFDVAIFGGLRSDFELVFLDDYIEVYDLRKSMFSEGIDTLRGIELLRFNDFEVLTGVASPSVQESSLTGVVYHWKSHQLLSGLPLSLKSLGSMQQSAVPFELRDLRFSADAGFSADLWLTPSASPVASFDVTLGLDVGMAPQFEISTEFSGWLVLSGSGDAAGLDTLTVAGFSQGDGAGRMGPFKVGTLSLPLLTTPEGLIDVHFLDGEIGRHLLSPYVQRYGSLHELTQGGGSFEFDSIAHDRYGISAVTAADNSLRSAVGSSDALDALKIAVGRNPNQGGTPLSPYQLISADVNGDGKVSSSDALAILKMVVGRSDAPKAEWILLDEKMDLWNESTNSFTTSRSSVVKPRDYQPVIDIQSDTQMNLVAMVKGDVNGSWTAPAASPLLPETYFTNLALANPNTINITQFG
jgi:hypothetical protein